MNCVTMEIYIKEAVSMLRTLTFAVILMDVLEILLCAFVFNQWLRTSRTKVAKPAFAFLALCFFNLGVWNFINGRYFLSAASSVFFLLALASFATAPFMEVWRICTPDEA